MVAANRSERARVRELVKKPAFEKRQRELELSERQRDRNLMRPVNKFQTLALKEMMTKRKKSSVSIMNDWVSFSVEILEQFQSAR